MELAQVHLFDPVDVSDVRRTLRPLLPSTLLQPYGSLGVQIVGPWRPADVWRGAPELLLWTVGFEVPGDALLNDEGRARIGGGTLARRAAPVHPAEHLAGRLGGGLVLLHSDAGHYAYTAIYRERHLRYSLMLVDHERLVRCDGVEVIVEAPPKVVPEGDRAGVLATGLERWCFAPVPMTPRDRIFLAERLAELVADAPIEWLVVDGSWDQEPERAVSAR